MTAIVIICVVVVAALAFWLVSVMMVARNPRRGVARGERLRGDVQGGMHVGGGRSVSPRRDEPATLYEPGVASGDTAGPDTAGSETGDSGEARHSRRGPSPMDL
jgi:hypothetical protein